ncbi:MAG: hypothetical protein N4A68_14420 [Maledivibacter sp.]|nr:hypothetical protein [Maledivibacter sp.]
MKNNKTSLKILLLRISCCLLTGILISSIFLGSINTNSWFTAKVESNISVSAATQDDILQTLEVVTDDNGNATKIRLKKNPNFKGNPIIYFGVDGVADQFTVHIDPVKLDTNKKIETDIEVNATVIQLGEMPSRVNGVLKVYYLNGYIYKELPVEFTKCYIWWNRVGWKFENEAQYRDSISKSMLRLAQERIWEEAIWQDYSDKPLRTLTIGTPETLTKSAAPTEMQSSSTLQDKGLEKSIDIEVVENPVSKLEITDEQNKLLDVVVPKLADYISKLYNTLEGLVNSLNNKIEEIARLKLNIQNIEEEKANLQKDYDELTIVKEDLTLEVENLTSENEDLSEENQELKDDIDKLQDKNGNLKSENFDLSSKISKLEKKIKELKFHQSSGASSNKIDNDKDQGSSEAEGNEGDQGSSEGNEGDQGSSEGNEGDQGSSEGNEGDQGSSEGNEGDQGSSEGSGGDQGSSGDTEESNN